jgi:ATP-binding cassette subfamily F protein uup
VALEHLTQALDVLDPEGRVLPTIESVRRVTRTAAGGDLTATAMLERFGFTGDRLTARIGDLSGGERRRFQLLRLLLSEPNVLLLDEPTNDLDIETLNVLEDYLDDWPGTLVVVSHDRYFLERVTDVIYGLLDDGQISLLPGGVDDYLARRRGSSPPPKWELPGVEVAGEVPLRTGETPTSAKARAGSAEERSARKVLARVEKRLEQVTAREAALNAEVLEHATDHERLTDLSRQLSEAAAEREELEAEWLEAAEVLE